MPVPTRVWPLLFLLLAACGTKPQAPVPVPVPPALPATAAAVPPTGDDPTALPGPDGRLYPDWRWAGVPGGIPAPAVVATVAACGGVPDDGQDDSAAFRQAIARAAAAGGGAVAVGPGTWHLERSLAIEDHGVVLRGAGADRTVLVVRHGEPPAGRLRVIAPDDGAAVGPGDRCEVHAHPDGLAELVLTVAGAEVARCGADTSGGGATWLVERWSRLAAGRAPGPLAVEARARWQDGREDRAAWTVRWDPARAAPAGGWSGADARHAIHLAGRTAGAPVALAADARRGGRVLTLAAPIPALAVGDVLQLGAPATPRWNQEIGSRLEGARAQRLVRAVVAAVDGARVELDRPLRCDLLVADGATALRAAPLRGAGVEALAIRQEVRSYTDAIALQDVYACFVREVRIERAGRHPVWVNKALRCELRGLDLDGAWYVKGGGTAYLGLEFAHDCLVDGARVRGLRHAPNVQWSSFANVFRQVASVGADMQWHAGYTTDNLFEQCVVDARRGQGGGSYGHAAFASGPDCLSHGPQGPRNVVWYCDAQCDLDALMLRGGEACRGWVVAHSRFLIRQGGPALSLQLGGGDHLLLGNVVATADPVGRPDYWAKPALKVPYNQEGAAVWFQRGSRIDGEASFPHRPVAGVQLVGNRFHGFRTLAAGAGALGGEQGNQLLPATTADPPRPQPPVESLFLWQRQRWPR
ncbi:MAG: hypothetical protein L6R48_00345 [Planctomycetes bacterium]|nr:hypothetical protein [Planctomycetota bacterium]